MPRPVDARETYLPGLDGVRALAVSVVVGYHLGIAKLSGGLLGVGIFFTLSGFLITSILLRSWRQDGNLGLGTFWLRRARRLLPALILVLLVVLAATALFSPGNFTSRAGDSLAAMFYVSNWTTIINGISYFSLFSPPGPLDHLWSLAVEEQFYLLWPLLLLAMLSLAKGKIARVALATSVLAALSFIALALLSHVGLDNTRAYEGTDTRAGGLLVGAVLAMLWVPNARAKSIPVGARVLLDTAGVAALAVIGWLVVSTDQYSLSLYHGGLLLLSVATAVLLAVVVHPGSSIGRVLGLAPLRWLGERSYGVYLWHLPVIVAFPTTFLRSVPVLRDGVLVALMLLVASLSWRFVENPIRTLGFRGAGNAAVSLLRSSTKPVLRIGATAGLLSLLLVSGVGAVQVMAVKQPTNPSLPVTSTTLVPQGQTNALKTSCKVLTFDGDSTSDGLISTSYLPNPADRIQARLFAVGVQSFHNEIAGAQSTTETWNGQPNAQQRISARWAAGVRGCWIFALGTNDSANISFRNSPAAPRIDAMMKLIHGEPVLWLTVKTLLHSSPYADVQMQKWNAALVSGCSRYPNMRIYDWRSEVQAPWYISDGIHFTSAGYQQRAKRIAAALARSFPAKGSAVSPCLVSSGIPG